MTDDKKNGIATADDFRKSLEFDPPERVVLPKLGLAVLLRRPSPMWLMFRGRLPVTLAARMSANADREAKPEDILASADWLFKLLQAVMVRPRCVMDPVSDDEISPDLIDMDDVAFIASWASGEEVDAANSLNTFRSERIAADAGAPG